MLRSLPAPVQLHRAHTPLPLAGGMHGANTRPLSSDLVRGVLPLPVSTWPFGRPCCILAEGWPSWISVCLHYPSDFSSVTIYTAALPPSVIMACRHRFSAWDWTSVIPLTLETDTILLIQGSRAFLLSLPDHLLALSSAVAFDHEYMVGQRPPARAGWNTARYCFTDYGGVICGRWCVSSRFSLPLQLTTGQSTFPALRLRHFLDPTVWGGVVEFHPSSMGKL